MSKTGGLHLTLVTSNGDPLHESVEVRLVNQATADRRTISIPAGKPLVISGLPAGIYQLDVVPAGFEIQSRTITVAPGPATEILMVFSRAKGSAVVPVFQVSDNVTEADLTVRLRSAIAGTAGTPDNQVIVWQDRGDEVAVHLSTLQVRLAPPAIFAAVDLESDQTGRGSLIVRFVFGDDQDPAGRRGFAIALFQQLRTLGAVFGICDCKIWLLV